jgi:hypothetical protein
MLWEICICGKQDFSQREECNHQSDGGLSDGRPSSHDPEQLNRFGIEDMYALRRTIFQSNHQAKIDLFVKVVLHDCNDGKFHQNEFVPG